VCYLPGDTIEANGEMDGEWGGRDFP